MEWNGPPGLFVGQNVRTQAGQRWESFGRHDVTFVPDKEEAKMLATRRTVAVMLNVAVLFVLAGLPASAAAQTAVQPGTAYAVAQVDQAEYEYVHGSLLYTHDGDDRLFGPEHDLCRDNIQALFQAYGLTTTLNEFEYYSYPGHNVIAEHLGTTRPNDVYIIGAHYDSVGNPGADDNASGVAGVLEIARLISQWPSDATIRLIAFDKEEWGLIGSDVYADAHSGDHILGMLSLDMIAYRANSTVGADIYGRAQSNDVKSALAAALSTYAQITASIGGEMDGSDQAPFEWRGFHAALLIEPDLDENPYYHQVLDSVDTPGYIDYEYAAAMTRGALAWLVEAAGVSPPHPLGDVNCDYGVDAADINAFVLALADPAGYAAAFPNCVWFNADANCDGAVDFGDINPFLALLLQPCQQPQVVGKLQAEAGQANDAFGGAVAVSGPRALVGAASDGELGFIAGAAYLFAQFDGVWTPETKLLAADGTARASFGYAVALSGNRALMGAPGDAEQGELAGAIYVFEPLERGWTQTAKLIGDDTVAYDSFGSAVALDGGLAVVGAPGADQPDVASDVGAAYVFERDLEGWTQVAKLMAADGLDSDYFGTTVALSGRTAVIGAPYHDALGEDAGAAYVFEQVGELWTPVAKLMAAEGRAYDHFGTSVSVSGDAAVVGTAYYDVASNTSASAAYVFERVRGTWVQTAKLGSWTHNAASAVGISGDTILIGRGSGNLPDNAGAAYIFQRRDGSWKAGTRLTAWDGVTSNQFGSAAAISGTTALVAARYDNDPPNSFGSVYVFELGGSGTPWIAEQPLDQTIQAGETAVFQVKALGPGTLSYQWRKDGRRLKDGGSVSGATTVTLTINPAGPANAGAYDVLVTSLCGATSSDSATLTVEAAGQ